MKKSEFRRRQQQCIDTVYTCPKTGKKETVFSRCCAECDRFDTEKCQASYKIAGVFESMQDWSYDECEDDDE